MVNSSVIGSLRRGEEWSLVDMMSQSNELHGSALHRVCWFIADLFILQGKEAAKQNHDCFIIVIKSFELQICDGNILSVNCCDLH